MRLVWLVGGVVGLLLVLMLVMIISVLAERGRPPDKASEADQRAAAAATVEEYLEAVAAADSAAVRRLLSEGYGSTALITDEVLAASAAAAPLTDIQVEVVSLTEGEFHPEAVVRATYRFGDDQVEQTFNLFSSSLDATKWIMLSDLTAIYTPTALSGIEVAVNGQVAPSGEDSLRLVVPGAYQVTATSPYYALENADLRLTSTEAPLPNAVPTLTDEGVQAFRTAVRSAVDTCLASKNLVAGCGLDTKATLTNGTIDEGTLTRTLAPETEAALATLEPTLKPGHPDVATCGTIGSVPTTAAGTFDGQHGIVLLTTIVGLIDPAGAEPLLVLQNPSVTMTDPALPVTW